MSDLEQDLSDLQERISFKEKRIAERLNVHDYKKCDELNEEVIGMRRKLREVEQERKRLSKSKRKSVLYQRKRETSSSSSNESERSTVSTIILTSSPSPDAFPPSQCALFSSPDSPLSNPLVNVEPDDDGDSDIRI